MALMRQLGDFFRAHKETIQGGYFGAANLRGTELESAASTGRLHVSGKVVRAENEDKALDMECGMLHCEHELRTFVCAALQ